MKVCILMGSPHPAGNTASLSRLFVEALSQNGCAVSALALYNLDLRPCTGCRSCQEVHSGFGCPQPDDMKLVFDAVLACDLLVLSSPIYSWYCTPPVKTVLDRLVYGAPNPGQGCAGSLYRIPEDPAFPHFCPCDGGILEAECAALLHNFFENRRA